MDDTDIKTCRICLKAIYENKFIVIGDTTRQMLDSLLLKLNFNVNEESLICNDCSTKLQNAVDFKIYCLDTENKILPLIHSEQKTEMVSKEATLKQRTAVIDSTDISNDSKMCHFCRTILENGCFTYLNKGREYIFIVDIIEKHIPELWLYFTEELVTCEICLDSLKKFSSFVIGCLDTEKKIKLGLERTDIDGKVEFRDIQDNPKYEVNVKSEILRKHEYEQVIIKNEIKYEIDVEAEHITIEKYDHPKYEDNVKDETIRKHDEYEHVIVKNEIKYESDVEAERVTIEKYDERKANIVKDEIKYENAMETGYLDLNTEVKLEKDSKSLQDNIDSSQSNSPETKLYNCTDCSFKTKYKYSLKCHKLTHKDISELTVYKCEKCSYQGKFKYYLKKHELIHQDIADLTTYHCEICSYKSVRKDDLKRHRLKHHDLLDVTSYNCTMCSYKAADRNYLRKHMLTHQSLSDRKMYKCEHCLFTTRYRASLRMHALIHRDVSEVTMYQCGECSYNTKHKRALKKHELVHKDILDVTMYKCDKCPYKTRHKNCLEYHVWNHIKPIE